VVNADSLYIFNLFVLNALHVLYICGKIIIMLVVIVVILKHFPIVTYFAAGSYNAAKHFLNSKFVADLTYCNSKVLQLFLFTNL